MSAMLLTSSVRCFFKACMAVLLNELEARLWLCRLCCAAKLAGHKQRLVTQDRRERICQGRCKCKQPNTSKSSCTAACCIINCSAHLVLSLTRAARGAAAVCTIVTVSGDGMASFSRHPRQVQRPDLLNVILGLEGRRCEIYMRRETVARVCWQGQCTTSCGPPRQYYKLIADSSGN
jgi:hypothetical protein